MPIEMTLALVGSVLTILGSLWATLSTVGRGWMRLERRFDALDRSLTELRHREDLQGAKVTAAIERLDHALALLDTRVGRCEEGIETLSGALAKYTAFKPRGPRRWPNEESSPHI